MDPRAPAPPEPEALAVPEAARRLGRSTEQVRRYLREGRLRGRRIGNQWFIEAGALAEFRTALAAGAGEGAFLARVPPGDVVEPLAETIGIGRGGGRVAIADGKDAYRRSARWRR